METAASSVIIDEGPAPEQSDPGEAEGNRVYWVTLPDLCVNIREDITTKYFFTLVFPCLFPQGSCDFHINRPRTLMSMSDWAEHLIWYKDGCFAQHQYFKFIVHNIIMCKLTLEQSTVIVKQNAESWRKYNYSARNQGEITRW